MTLAPAPSRYVCTPAEFKAADTRERRGLVWEQIVAHPELHDQDDWAFRHECHTTYCVAGWAAVLAGWKPVFPEDDRGGNPNSAGKFQAPDGSLADPDTLGQELLGFTEDEAKVLFYDITAADEIKDYLI